MSTRSTAWPLLVLLPALLTGCGTFSKKSAGLRRVDDFLERVERVQVASELAIDRMHGAVTSLEVLAEPGFRGDPMVAYSAYVEAVEQSEDQADELRRSLESMESGAKAMFEQWAEDLKAFTSADMRRRSQVRLVEARKRYEAIVTAVTPAMWGYDSLNQGLRDHATFLEHDYNSAAVAEIADGVRDITDQAAELDGRFEASVAAAQAYVRSAALPGQMPGDQAETARDPRKSEG